MCIEPIHSSVLGICISEDRNMLIAEKFIQSLVSNYGKHIVLQMEVHGMMKHVRHRLKHYLHSPFQKSLMESQPIF
jgi:hypothetical protein